MIVLICTATLYKHSLSTSHGAHHGGKDSFPDPASIASRGNDIGERAESNNPCSDFEGQPWVAAVLTNIHRMDIPEETAAEAGMVATDSAAGTTEAQEAQAAKQTTDTGESPDAQLEEDLQVEAEGGAASSPPGGLSTCSECRKDLPTSSFSKGQKKKKAKRRCKNCVEGVAGELPAVSSDEAPAEEAAGAGSAEDAEAVDKDAGSDGDAGVVEVDVGDAETAADEQETQEEQNAEEAADAGGAEDAESVDKTESDGGAGMVEVDMGDDEETAADEQETQEGQNGQVQDSEDRGSDSGKESDDGASTFSELRISNTSVGMVGFFFLVIFIVAVC